MHLWYTVTGQKCPQEVKVARVMINCPETGESVYTGMTFDWPSFENVRIGEKSVRCSACGDEHTWKRPDAFLEEDGGSA